MSAAKSKSKGGHAFPTIKQSRRIGDEHDSIAYTVAPGLTARQWLAGLAMSALIQRAPEGFMSNHDLLINDALVLADGLIAGDSQ